ncbi:unnamed protein product [Effrenium voratum]|uniref:Uncharacterized protein n=1 Tax=Effrenium voratum TaxID=2562239 RepID=A0AA36HNB4_9DINO|nr:unnamed protein product [Effrenium voratum]CAJ1434897.1 unnamed protein product [Effrenium voratum]
MGALCAPEAAPTEPAHEMFFPMYVVKVSDFLQMEGPPESHCALLEKGLLHRWHPDMFAIFVSHQWLGYAHPDPDGRQVATLRAALRGVIAGSIEVEADIVTEYAQARYPRHWQQAIAEGYLFFDWFAIPQITARAAGVNEDAVKSKAALAVQSIPAYVEVANIFVSLVPYLTHVETGKQCSYASWVSRGWCRAELWCHVLAKKPDTRVVIIYSKEELEFMYPLQWQQHSITTGNFTVESDREVVVKLGELALRSKIEYLSKAGPLSQFRFYLSQVPRLLQEKKRRSLEEFLAEFRFESLQQAVQDTSSMTAVMCALFSGDENMLRLLVNQKAELNFGLKGLEGMGYFDSQTPLMAALKSQQEPRLIEALLELRADLNAASRTGIKCTYLVRTPEHVQVLLSARADFSVGGPAQLSPLTGAAAFANAATVKALLDVRCDPNILQPDCGRFLGYGPLHAAAIHSRENAEAVEIAKLLLEHNADLNARANPKGILAPVFFVVGQIYGRMTGLQKASRSVLLMSSLPGVTPLGILSWAGNEQMARLLLDHGAEMLPNDMGHSPEDMARLTGQLHLLPHLATFHV